MPGGANLLPHTNTAPSVGRARFPAIRNEEGGSLEGTLVLGSGAESLAGHLLHPQAPAAVGTGVLQGWWQGRGTAGTLSQRLFQP